MVSQQEVMEAIAVLLVSKTVNQMSDEEVRQQMQKPKNFPRERSSPRQKFSLSAFARKYRSSQANWR